MCQEGHSAVKTECWYYNDGDPTGDFQVLRVLAYIITTSSISCCIKIQNGFTFWYWLTRLSRYTGQWPLWRRWLRTIAAYRRTHTPSQISVGSRLVPFYIRIKLLLSCAKSHMLSASRLQPHLLHVSAVDRRQTWSMDKSWRCVTLSGFLHSHTVRCWWNPISCGMHYSGPGLSENDSAVTTDVCEDRNREVRLWGLPLKWNWPL